MKILLIGAGSIGRRHLGNLLHLGYTNISVVSRLGKVAAPYNNLAAYTTVDEALAADGFDAALVCVPTAQHVPAVNSLLQHRVRNIYIEKPVSHNLEGLTEIETLAAGYTNNIVVGYDLHFDPGLQQVKDLLQTQTMGRVVSVNAQVGQYLPDWRPHEDYRQGMSAKKATGGGVMLDLVHEFDYLQWLVGPVEAVASCHVHSGALDIETEDVAEVLLRFANGTIGTIHLDYLQPHLVRNCLLTCTGGSIYWNLANSMVTWTTHDKQSQQFVYKDYERNQRFLDIMQAFMEGGADGRLTTLQQGIESLKTVMAARMANAASMLNPGTLPVN